MRPRRGVAILAAAPAMLAFQAPQTVYLFGTVLLDSGFPPPEGAAVELVCGNPADRAVPRTRTDSSGRFSLGLGDAAIAPDAPDGAGAGGVRSRTPIGLGGPREARPMRLMNCELRVSLKGYRAEPMTLAGRRPFDHPDVGVIVLHRLAQVKGRTVSITSLQAPKDARKAYEKGRDALEKNKPETARRELRKAVTLYPKYAAA